MIKKVELEITSDCNAACPGCARTLNKNLLQINAFTFEDLKRMFPAGNYNGVEFKFCGVLGDPIVNPDCLKMIEWLVYNGGYCEISTNGGYNTVEWWNRLGQVAAAYPGKLHIHFCIDGHKETNHIYRVNTKWNTIERNIAAFAETAPEKHATWVYIVFDHNEHELETAKTHAGVLGFEFATRTGMRNSYHNWIAQLGKKDNRVKKTITTTGNKEHSKKDVVKSLDDFIKNYKSNNADKTETKEIINSIVCKYIHEGEIFIANNLTMWPCCFLWDSAFKNSENIIEKLEIFEPNWNSLKHHSIAKIQQHPWFRGLLAASWDPNHELHFSRCIRTCAKNKAYHNEIKYTDN
jgi:MoaA/NifB/PqqE/SkfB family radical SAM enzyme